MSRDLDKEIAELKEERDRRLEELPEWFRRRKLAEYSAGKSILEEHREDILLLAEKVSKSEVVYVSAESEIEIIRVTFRPVQLERFMVDSQEVRDFFGFSYRDCQNLLSDFQESTSRLNAKIVFVRWTYTDDFIGFCGEGRYSLPIKYYTAIPPS